ncbi:alkaline phosphatase family protein [Pusillimonas sp. MFBS29]|uniref:phosphoric/sulfuric ester hydrolase PehA n=1 Tax=Pusillimonas sp. MFBS29 TaxID=2886690 RepID=UPI001D108FB8|nr:phosphoric/sulfuric ester hydrolase PehA [Pusillimonas sp. MFBS29]MCC2596251.1 alkaline phosphatase family protein [Pusillimonas sp. MFBS29]
MQQKKNVLLIVVDQWRGDTLPNLGHHVQLPNVSRLAAEGVTFAHHYTQAVPCGPGRASLLTGMYMMNHRATQNTIPLDARHTNVAWESRKGGYEPALVGYTTTTPDPRYTDHEDPRFRVLGGEMDGWKLVGSMGLKMESYFAWVAHRWPDMPSTPEDMWLPRDADPDEIGATTSPSLVPAEFSDTSFFTEKALEYLHGVRHKPWFLHLGYWRPHPPFIAPEPWNSMYDPEDSPAPVRAESPEQEAAQHPLTEFYLNNVGRKNFFRHGEGLAKDMSIDEVKQMRATYYGLMSEVDAQLGRIFDFLEKTGQWDDTLIIFTSDHAEQLGDHHMLGKLGYFDQSYHIPMIVRDPRPTADASRGKIVRDFTETIDTMPTILEWMGLPVPRSCDGASLLPFLAQGQAPQGWRTEVHYEFDFRNIFYSTPEEHMGTGLDDSSLSVVQDHNYKYVHFTNAAPLFFDLKADPAQLNNLANDPAQQHTMLRYAQKMLSWRMRYMDRTLTAYAASPEGLLKRA